jgi:sugar-specific transcriptional regulator TrmB
MRPPHAGPRVSTEARRRALEELGIQGYAARVYVALTDSTEPMTARDVAQLAGVPQGRVYEVLEQLHLAGALEVVADTPKRYRAVDFGAFFDRKLRAQAAETEALRERRAELTHLFTAPTRAVRGPSDLVVLRDEAAIEDRSLDLVRRARRDILTVGSAASAERVLGWGTAVEEAVARKVRWRIAMPVHSANRAQVDAVLRLGVEVRRRPDDAPAVGVSVHDESRVILFKAAEPGAGAPEVIAYVLEEPEMARLLREMAEACWARAEPVR